MLKYAILGLIGLTVAFAVYVRLAPSDPARWHVSFYPKPPDTYPAADGFQIVRQIDDPAAVLARLDTIIMATPRTVRLAGSVEEGMITYVTRSKLWGFPDYTTVYAGADDTIEGTFGPLLKVDGRLRFGQSDMGVNRARIEGWLAELDA
jgi:uncharacterized protein (DUF1499 family)